MIWSSPLRVLGLAGISLLAVAACGGNPSVSNNDPGTNGGSGGMSGGANVSGTKNGPDLNTGGMPDDSEGGSGEQPTSYVCGNGELEPGEFCDDGNVMDGDGCSGDCKTLDPKFDCSAVGEPCVQTVICGDSIIEGDEACDDGNEMDMDGCSADCAMVEDGYECVRPGKECVKVSICGNAERERGEACDDGNVMTGDGCDDKCKVEAGFYCPLAGGMCDEQKCGNTIRTPDEECEDHNTTAGDGCSAQCKVEAGWHCNSAGCKPECGDGLLRGDEVCDDGNTTGGDGCSTACKVEPFHNCTKASPSVCSSSISCGNGNVEPGEVCDPPGQNGCKAGCKSFDPDTSSMAMCGNSVIEDTETCDPPNVGKGCSAACKVENGYTCPQAGVCFRNPFCGDNVVQTGEGCDPPNVGKGCDAACKVENGWTCVGLGPSTCVKPVCGNGSVEPGEQCDDGSAGGVHDGCFACAIDNGWSCPNPGAACIPKCGDGIKVGTEQCDDGPANRASGDGCNAGCKLEFGYTCPTAGAKCVKAVCGDGGPPPANKPDPSEGCDYGDTIAGDGCGPTCQLEPSVTVGPNPVVNVKCGDGLVTSGEACDDGNTTNGDGCEGDCKSVTNGFTCTPKATLPGTLQMQVKYRDFKAGNATSGDGHTDFQYKHLGHVAGITGVPCTTALNKNMKATPDCGQLDAEGKPVLVVNNQATTGIMSDKTFRLWWRDANDDGTGAKVKNANGNNIAMKAPFVRTLTLTQTGGVNSDVYVYNSNGNNFYPLDGVAGNYGSIGAEVPLCNNNSGVTNVTGSPACDTCDANCRAHDFNFTTELRYFFQYKGGEQLSFTGDDDVWVYINGRLAVDIGGLHGAQSGQVVLGDDGNGVAGNDSGCSAHSVDNLPDPNGGCYSTAEKNDNFDDRFGLEKGKVYEIVLFHAERHTTASNFKLTLAGFLAPRSSCDTNCGDGTVAGDEVCEPGQSTPDQAGACNATCTAFAYCGDGVKQNANPVKMLPAEACDNGTNTDLYKTAQSPANVCAPGCVTPPSCGDGVLQAAFEQCDKGNQNSDASYGPNSCTTQCKLGGYCGDGTPQVANGEACDKGALNGKEYGANSCGYDCKAGPRCGDHIRNGTEQCDDGSDNGMATSHCDTDCTIKPYCGDGVKQVGEECDYGQFASTEYGGCSDMCMFGPRCGDGGPGNTPDLEEECDYGSASNTGMYGGCKSNCTLGPRCGDGIKNGAEACDNGFNEDEYDDPDTVAVECGNNCTPVPYCGDAHLDVGFELCDLGAPDPQNPTDPTKNNDTAYDGCTTKCVYGPFCGDGVKNGPEKCDKGADNVGYSPTQGACGYDCNDAPWCGDGIRNGPEQCDLGDGKNTGDYGTCNADCTFAPRCGDGVKNGNEQCDDGPTGSLKCSAQCRRRDVVQ